MFKYFLSNSKKEDTTKRRLSRRVHIYLCIIILYDYGTQFKTYCLVVLHMVVFLCQVFEIVFSFCNTAEIGYKTTKFRIKWCILFCCFLLHFFTCAKSTLYTVALYNLRCNIFSSIYFYISMSIYKSHVSNITDVSIHGQFAMILKVCAYGITTLFFIIAGDTIACTIAYFLFAQTCKHTYNIVY